jgi:hypothetical protein
MLNSMQAVILWLSKTGYCLLLVAMFQAPVAALAQQQGSVLSEHYGGEARIGSEPPFPVHLEIRRTPQGIEGIVRSYDVRFSLDEAQGSEVVTATLGGPGGGPVSLTFTGDEVRGQFELGGQPGTLQATRTPKNADDFFRPPAQNLDLSPREWREDLDRLAEILTTRHGSPFHRTSRSDFERQLERVRTALPRLSGPQVALEFRKLAALIGDGHTTVAAPTGRPFYPLEMFWFEDGIRAVSIAQAHQELLGAKLTQVAGIPVADVIRRLRPFVAQGESAWSYRYLAPFLIAEHDVLSNAGIGTGQSRTFTFELIDGSTRHIQLEASTEPVKRAILGGERPLWSRAPTEPFRVTRLSDGSLYVNWRTYDQLLQRGTALVQDIESDRPQRLIVDLRDSGGGDFNVGREFIRLLASKPWLNRPDRLFVLTGRRTFSAAMTNAVDFRKMTQATLIGEPPGAAPNNWQEVRFFHLPNSGLQVGVSTLYYEFLPGEDAVRPDIYIPPTPSDWGSERDAAVRYILAIQCPLTN